jgi:hypothetical protein
MTTTEQPERMGVGAPTIGRIVLYTLNKLDADFINQRRKQARENGRLGEIAIHYGNDAAEGQIFPADVVRDHGGSVNLQVKLDGTDTYWATSAAEGDQPGTWAWPPRV